MKTFIKTIRYSLIMMAAFLLVPNFTSCGSDDDEDEVLDEVQQEIMDRLDGAWELENKGYDDVETGDVIEITFNKYGSVSYKYVYSKPYNETNYQTRTETSTYSVSKDGKSLTIEKFRGDSRSVTFGIVTLTSTTLNLDGKAFKRAAEGNDENDDTDENNENSDEENNDEENNDDDNPSADVVAVDLGLPSGTWWANMNVGASKPEDYGGYYAWGETERKDSYEWDTYKYGYYSYDGDYSHLVNIGTDISGTEYDVAHVKWGGDWKMPTYDQFKELCRKCSSEWTTVNGINGRKFTGPNGNSIFLPAAGYRFFDSYSMTTESGLYRSSTLGNEGPNEAYILNFDSQYAGQFDTDRCDGFSVRPVMYVPNIISDLSLSTITASIEVGSTSTVEITAGSGSYTVVSDKPAVATAVLSGTTITITGVAAGAANITVTDTESEQAVTIAVTVVAAIPDLALSANTVSLAVGAASTVEITSGSGSYTATSSAPAIATVVISGNNVVITANSSGSTLVTVKDTQSEQTATIAVTVVDATNGFALSTNAVTIEVGATATVEVTAGSGNYRVISDVPAVATASLNGSTITITGVTIGTAAIVVIDNFRNLTAKISVKVTSPNKSNATAVDLGLPSGTKWANMNVGASAPEEFGDYFAWGETEQKEWFNWDNYKWCNGTKTTLTKYCVDPAFGTVDNKDILDPEDDVAHVKWGGSWKIPTYDQVKELITNCSSEWININGINGRRFTGPNGNSIFLPAANDVWGSTFPQYSRSGNYWSSETNLTYPNCVVCLYFLSDIVRINDEQRAAGLQVRPVQ